MTPRIPPSPHYSEDAPLSPFNPHTPHTPLYVLSPSADASAYTVGRSGTAAHLVSYHSITEVPASGSGQLQAAFSLDGVQALVAERVHAVLGSAVGDDDPLMAAGLDSLGAMELQQSLANTLGIELPSTLVFDYPTVNAMADFLAARLGVQAMPGAGALSPVPALPSTTAAHASAGAAVAIAGAAGQHELRHRWADASARVPLGRWDVDSPLITADGTLPSCFGVFLPDVELFDGELFGVMRSEALTMDPQQRLLLHAALEALPAGSGRVAGRSVGTFVGIAGEHPHERTIGMRRQTRSLSEPCPFFACSNRL